jgi:hypothetical protein
MKILIAFTFYFILINTPSALAKTFGGSGLDHGYQVIKTNDNGYALLGQYDSLGSDIYVVKTDSGGNILWQKTYGSFNQDDYANSILQTTEGGYLVIGTTTDQNSNLRAWLLRLNSSGDTLWTKIYNDPSSLMQSGAYIDLSGPDKFTIGINSDGISLNNNLYLYRTDTMGNILSTLSTSAEYGSVMPVTNGYLMTATNTAFPPPSINITRLDTAGSLNFDKFYYDQNFARSFRANGSAVCGSGFLTAGSTDFYSSSNGQYRFYLLRTDSTGDSLWAKSWGTNFSSLNCIVTSGISDFLIAGNTDSSGHREDFIWKTDSVGDTLWTRYLGNNLTVFSILPLDNGSFMVIGDSTDAMSGLTDMWIMWYDSSGIPLFDPTTGINRTDDLKNISVYPNPATERIRIVLNDKNQSVNLSISEINGDTIFRKRIEGSEITIDVSTWNRGVYFLNYADSHGRVMQSEKLILE